MSEPESYTLRWRGRQLGPYSRQEIDRKLDEHEIGMGHEISYQGKWITLQEFFAALEEAEPIENVPQPGQPAQAGPGKNRQFVNLPYPASVSSPRPGAAQSPRAERPSPALSSPPPVRLKPPRGTAPRRRLLYAFLGVFLGFLGVHNYYARHWLTGLLQLLLSIATLLLGFGIIAPWLWAWVEALVVRKDGNGVEMI